MNTRVKRVQRLEADHGTDHKSAAEMTDAELCRIAGVPLDVTNEELERIVRAPHASGARARRRDRRRA